nr:MAG TPA: hypothetical protein [Caudoviricetes sp.]
MALLNSAPPGGSSADDVFFQRREECQGTKLIQNHPIPRDFFHLPLCLLVVIRAGNAQQRSKKGINSGNGANHLLSMPQSPHRRNCGVERCRSRQQHQGNPLQDIVHFVAHFHDFSSLISMQRQFSDFFHDTLGRTVSTGSSVRFKKVVIQVFVFVLGNKPTFHIFHAEKNNAVVRHANQQARVGILFIVLLFSSCPAGIQIPPKASRANKSQQNCPYRLQKIAQIFSFFL